MQLNSSGHTLQAIGSLLNLGWNVEVAPANARLLRNGQQLRLRWGTKQRALRVFIYKITGSGRNQHERRLEITTTYQKGLVRTTAYEDVVLGFEPSMNVFVGVDARRIEHGGSTGNASSFIDPEGLTLATDAVITILRRQSQLFGIERHAYFKPSRLAEYLVNVPAIHRGTYDGSGDFCSNVAQNRISYHVADTDCHGSELVMNGPTNVRQSTTLRSAVLRAFEAGDSTELGRLQVSQQEFVRLNARLQEIGLKGEEFVLKAEVNRLRRGGRPDLAAKVSWISQVSPFVGYDILSFETDASKRHIEVKSTTGQSRKFPMTDNEWRVASAIGDRYFIYRVTNVETHPATIQFQNPVLLEGKGQLKLSPLSWIVTY